MDYDRLLEKRSLAGVIGCPNGGVSKPIWPDAKFRKMAKYKFSGLSRGDHYREIEGKIFKKYTSPIIKLIIELFNLFNLNFFIWGLYLPISRSKKISFFKTTFFGIFKRKHSEIVMNCSHIRKWHSEWVSSCIVCRSRALRTLRKKIPYLRISHSKKIGIFKTTFFCIFKRKHSEIVMNCSHIRKWHSEWMSSCIVCRSRALRTMRKKTSSLRISDSLKIGFFKTNFFGIFKRKHSEIVIDYCNNMKRCSIRVNCCIICYYGHFW